MVHVLLADQNGLDDLKASFKTFSSRRTSREPALRRTWSSSGDTAGGTFPERRRLFALSSAFMIGHFTRIAQWATWAVNEIET